MERKFGRDEKRYREIERKKERERERGGRRGESKGTRVALVNLGRFFSSSGKGRAEREGWRERTAVL